MASKMYALAVFGTLVVSGVLAFPWLLSWAWAFGGLYLVFFLVDELPARIIERRSRAKYDEDIRTGRRKV